MPLLGEQLGVGLVVGPARVAAVDDHVALAEQLAERRDGLAGRVAGRAPSPRRPWGAGSASTSASRRVDVGDVGVAVVADDRVPGVAQPVAHVAAHLAEPDRVRCPCGPSWCVRSAWAGCRDGRLRTAGAAASAGSGSRGRASPSPAAPLMTTGLEAWVKASSTTASSMAVRPSSRNCGLKPVVMSSPSMVGLDRLGGLRLVAGAGVEGEHAVAEGQLDRGVALGDQRDPLDRLDQRGLVDQRGGQVLGGEQAADLGELAVEQPGRGAAYAAAGACPRSR